MAEERSFGVTLNDIRDGRLLAELTTRFNELVSEVQHCMKPGEITLKIKIKPASRGDSVDRITLTDEVKVTPPKSERGEDFFWVNSEGQLSRNHPRQGELALRDITTLPATNFKEVTR